MMNQGIYHILNLSNSKVYIGSSKNFAKRKARHLDELRRNCHHSSKLQNSFNKHGEDSFVIELIEVVFDLSFLEQREQFWIDKANSFNDGFNNRPKAETQQGLALSDEAKEKIAASKRNIPLSESHKEKLRLAAIGRKATKGRIGQPHSEETKAKMRLAAKGNKAAFGKKQTAEHIAKRFANRKES
jgi:group I intron endonuclease